MFNFNDLNTQAGGDGLPGPFINWQAKTGDHAQGQTWTLRMKEEGQDQSTIKDITAHFQAGVIFDYNSIKMGWEKHAPMGQRNDVAWAPTMDLASFARPSNDKRSNDMGNQVFVWRKIFAIRIALSQSEAGTWSTSQVSGFRGFDGFIDQLKKQGPQHPNKLPVVQFTGTEEAYGGSVAPVLVIAKWVDTPQCLKKDTGAATIQTGGAEPTPATPAPAATPAVATAADDLGF